MPRWTIYSDTLLDLKLGIVMTGHQCCSVPNGGFVIGGRTRSRLVNPGVFRINKDGKFEDDLEKPILTIENPRIHTPVFAMNGTCSFIDDNGQVISIKNADKPFVLQKRPEFGTLKMKRSEGQRSVRHMISLI